MLRRHRKDTGGSLIVLDRRTIHDGDLKVEARPRRPMGTQNGRK